MTVIISATAPPCGSCVGFCCLARHQGPHVGTFHRLCRDAALLQRSSFQKRPQALLVSTSRCLIDRKYPIYSAWFCPRLPKPRSAEPLPSFSAYPESLPKVHIFCDSRQFLDSANQTLGIPILTFCLKEPPKTPSLRIP